jgi:hypothetical protein
MDIKQRVMDDSPNSWLHKIAGIVPGFKGYMDRERRRDADKLLRTHIARQYSAQRDRLNRVQQSLLRERRMDAIGEVDRMAGVLQRLIDRINTATYGYTGMFDAVKIEAEDLDQLYAFDMALASGADQVSSAISALDDAQGEKLDAAAGRLATLLDDLNERMNQRSELLTSGKRLPSDEYESLLNTLEPLPPYEPGKAGGTGGGDISAPTGRGSSSTGAGSPGPGGMGGSSTAGGYQPGMSPGTGSGVGTTDMSLGTIGSTGGNQARVGGMGEEGTPTTNLNAGSSGSGVSGDMGGGTNVDTGVGADAGTGLTAGVGSGSLGTGASLEPGVSSLAEGDQSMHAMQREESMGGIASGPLPLDDSAGGGVQSASSPAGAPGAPGHDIVDGMQIARNMEQVSDVDSGDVSAPRPAEDDTRNP